MLFSRFGAGGPLKRLRSLPHSIETSATLQFVPSSANGLGGGPTGPDPPRSCSTITNAHVRNGGLCHAAFQQGPNQQYSSSRDRTNEAGSQHATSDAELHKRLAALWGMPSELLFERQQLFARMLDPAGVGSPAQALWLLVRAPQLRHASEASLRASLKQLHRLVSHADIDRAAVLTAVYKYPWVVEAVADNAPLHTDAAGPGPAAAAAAAPAQQSSAAAPATWTQELAAVVLELQQADHAEHVASGGTGSRGLRMSPGFAAAAVRTYLAVSEVAQRVSNTAGRIASSILFALPGPNPPEVQAARAAAAARSAANRRNSISSSSGASSFDFSSPGPAPAAAVAECSPAPQQQQQQPQQPHPSSPAAADHPEACSGVGEVLARLQQEQQQHLLLQQLLVSCPHLTVLPPELLLARYERLQSVVHLGADAAAQLVAANPFLLVTYNDDAAARAEAQALRMSYA